MKIFVDLLSTGTLKLIHEGKDFWFMVSGGAFRIQDGSLSVLAQYAQGAETVATEETIARLKLVEAELSKVTDTQAQDYITLSSEKNRLDSSLEASRRHTMS